MLPSYHPGVLPRNHLASSVHRPTPYACIMARRLLAFVLSPIGVYLCVLWFSRNALAGWKPAIHNAGETPAVPR